MAAKPPFLHNARVVHQGGACNNRCVTCQKTSTEMSYGDILTELDAAADLRKGIFFADRDLLCRPDLAELLRAITMRKLRFGFATNGRRLARPGGLERLQKVGLAYLRFTLHAGSSYPHFLITHEEGFGAAVEGLRLALSTDLEVDLCLPINRYNKGSLKRAMLLLETMPREMEPIFEPEAGVDFSREIDEAFAYRAVLKGRYVPRASAGLRFYKTDKTLELNLHACPFRATGTTLTQEPLSHVLFREKEGLYRLYRLEAGNDAQTLFTTKNARGLLYWHTKHGLVKTRLEEACFSCRLLASCHGAFTPEEPESPFRLQRYPTDQTARWCDLSEGQGEDAIKRLREEMQTLPPGQRLGVYGQVPWLVLGEEAPEARELADIHVGIVADLASIHGLEAVAYSLPHHSQSPEFWVVYEKREVQHGQENERTGVLCVSSACVADCVMCSLPKLYAGHAVPTPQVPPLMEELKLCGFTALDTFGGEITLRKDLVELIAYAKHLGFYAMIITTGYGVDEAFLSALTAVGLDKIEVALDANEPALHDHIKGRKGLFEYAVRAIHAATKNPKLYVEVNSVILSDNLRQLVALHRFVAEELGGRRHRFFHFIQIPTSLTKPRWLSPAQARDFLTRVKPELLALSSKLGTKIDFCPSVDITEGEDLEPAIARISSGIYQEPTPCRAPERDVMVMPDGEIYGCMSPMVIHRCPPLGLIGEGKLIDALHGGILERWKREAGTWPECRSCISRR